MSGSRATLPLLSVSLWLGGLACQSAPMAMATEQQPGWVMVPPTEMRKSGTLAHPRLAAVGKEGFGKPWLRGDLGQ